MRVGANVGFVGIKSEQGCVRHAMCRSARCNEQVSKVYATKGQMVLEQDGRC
jgi:hypothetical protein